MSASLIILCIFLFLLFLISSYVLYRNEKVSRFRRELIDIADEGCKRHLKELNNKDYLRPFSIYESVRYEKMLYSFKPLKLEYWYTEDEIKQMKGDDL